jgi:hypothetical protein
MSPAAAMCIRGDLTRDISLVPERLERQERGRRDDQSVTISQKSRHLPRRHGTPNATARAEAAARHKQVHADLLSHLPVIRLSTSIFMLASQENVARIVPTCFAADVT